MPTPASLYEGLLAAIPAELTVVHVDVGKQWVRVTNSAGSTGIAWALATESRPRRMNPEALVDAPLPEVAGLIRGWNLAECSLGQAAINSWYSNPDTAAANGFVPTGQGVTWVQAFDPYADRVAGKKVAVIGHFPFAEAALEDAGEFYCLERNVQEGDYPDSACEYLLPQCDYVFISGSAFVNKTAPRLLELSRHAHSVLIGPSTPLSPLLFDYDVDTVTGFISTPPQQQPLLQIGVKGMPGAGYRVHRHRSEKE